MKLINNLTPQQFLPYYFFAVFVVSVKFIIIHFYGNATPFWDQWSAQGLYLFLPWLQGSMGLNDLLASHNEHRIFTMRLLALGLLELNGKVWNPILEMQVNAVLHTLSLLVFL